MRACGSSPFLGEVPKVQPFRGERRVLPVFLARPEGLETGQIRRSYAASNPPS